MVEISSCQVTVEIGQHIDKGDQLGMFHFEGSAYCLVLEPHVRLAFIMKPATTNNLQGGSKLNNPLAIVMNDQTD
ncbi:uncharacterized protein BDW43DRAFT_293577 [Aspergillus alliaceus]|uniref:uncharacterized protein n=1 Tax=Petromyces alliaceus TaxID=209559 RepID=UPI0012A64D9D|nr:uncharacterized protein BDW43DRAFT_293577 [Aspergillus alliaceus]KAB8227659.1 hypothetical protein BDW43DRAFT_293577 [Aspergillus alliaceus]